MGLLLRLFAKRYVAGNLAGDAAAVARELAAKNILSTIDNLGENVRTEAESRDSVAEYLRLLDLVQGFNAGPGAGRRQGRRDLKTSPFQKGGLRRIRRNLPNPPYPPLIRGGIDRNGRGAAEPPCSLAGCGKTLPLPLPSGEANAGITTTVSFKLTHLGLDVSTGLAKENAERILTRAGELGNFARFDMEGSAYTERTLEIFLDLFKTHSNTGIAIQSALKRSAADVRTLIDMGASIRLVKGAYKEQADIAFEKKADVDRNYETLMKEILMHGVRPAIATHDERLIAEVVRFTEANNIDREGFEFQMLLGIKQKLQQRLVAEGFSVRVYIPYGPHWLPYTLRRLGERRENLYFFLRNIIE